LLEGVDLSGARGVLVNITANRSLKLSETKEVMNTIRSYAADDATVIFGTVYDESMGDAMRVTVVATGLSKSTAKTKQKPELVSWPMTGTHGASGMRVTHTVSSDPSRDYNDLEMPAVWRNTRESASAHVAALQEKGVDTYDIPAFLRKQAD
jgi:cell division protein FtsZ